MKIDLPGNVMNGAVKPWSGFYQGVLSFTKSVGEMRLIFFFCLTFLVLFRFRALFFPPYWDGVMAPFTEAIWLSENKFDFMKLATQVPGYKEGGAKIYLYFSIYPTVQAVFMSLIKNTKVLIFLNHCVALGLASAGIAFYYQTVARAIGKRYAALAGALLFFHPLFLSQAYVISMEMPAIFFSIAAIYFLAEGKPFRAACLMFISFLIKYYAVIASLGCILVLLGVDMQRPVKFKSRVIGAGLFCLPCLIHFLERKVFGSVFPVVIFNAPYKFLPTENEWVSKWFFFLDSPDLALFGLFALLGGLSFFYTRRREMMQTVASLIVRPSAVSAVRLLPGECLLPFYSSILCVFLALSFYFEVDFLPRYALFFLPWVLFLVVFELKKHSSSRTPLFVFLALVFYALNMWGQIYSLIPFSQRFNYADVLKKSGHLLERTLAYEDDMNANLELVHLLETKYKGRNIITSIPIAHSLLSPQFGYVDAPRQVATVGRRCFVWKDVPDLDEIDPKDPEWKNAVWIYSENIFSYRFRNLFVSRRLIDMIRRGTQVIYLFSD